MPLLYLHFAIFEENLFSHLRASCSLFRRAFLQFLCSFVWFHPRRVSCSKNRRSQFPKYREQREKEKDTQILTVVFFFPLTYRTAWSRRLFSSSDCAIINYDQKEDNTRLDLHQTIVFVQSFWNCSRSSKLFQARKKESRYTYTSRFLGLSLFPLDFKQDYFTFRTTLNTIRRVSAFCCKREESYFAGRRA